VSIYGSILTIEDERQWVADLRGQGISAEVIRDGDPESDDLDAPLIYQGSHVLPEDSHPRGGYVGLAHIAAHVRFWRENPDAPLHDEPWLPAEPFLRLSVVADETTYQGGGDATVVLTSRQATRLRDALNDWLISTTGDLGSSPESSGSPGEETP
jgi:hypothetical protein